MSYFGSGLIISCIYIVALQLGEMFGLTILTSDITAFFSSFVFFISLSS